MMELQSGGVTCDTEVRYQVINGPDTLTVQVNGPLYCPYHNRWGQDIYTQGFAFKHDPFHSPALSTCGSPVIMDQSAFFCGFLNDRYEDNCTFCYDGTELLHVNIPEGQQLFVSTSAPTDAAWKTYNSLVMQSEGISVHPHIESHWILPEYCTWVEQKRVAEHTGKKANEVISERFISDFIKRLDELDYPRGKLTIDDGWTPSSSAFGDWISDTARFPSMERVAREIERAGHVPGLWLAPVWVHELSEVAFKHPEWVGVQALTAQGEPNNLKPINTREERHYWHPAPELEEHFRQVFQRYTDIGFKKFKLDMAYGDKSLMKQLHGMMYRAVKSIDSSVEMEIHHPDIFFTKFGDTIRTNDVLCNDSSNWRNLTQAHFSVCYKSAPNKVINLDHIGGNDPKVTDQDFIEHINLYRQACGHPVVSLLPDSHGETCREALRSYLWDYVKKPNAVSKFFNSSLIETNPTLNKF